MKKNIIKKICFIILFFLVTYIFCYMTFFKNNLILCSGRDWIMQHSQFPDYFRKLFYNDKILIPQFSFNLGSGQNIFNMAYYGILNPLIIISYLFPNVPMYIYMGALGMFIIISTGILSYIWFYRNGYSKINSLVSALYIMFAAGFVKQSFANYMFVSYMPFLIIAFIGIDLYFEKNIKSLFIIGSALCIVVSYVFAPSYSIAIIIYGIYKYLTVNKKITLKSFTIAGVKFGSIYSIAILLTFIMLLPTVLATFGGRLPNGTHISILKTLRPRINLQALIYYNGEGPGLTSVGLFFLLINLFNKENKFIKIIAWFLFLSMSSVFLRSALNGFMYDGVKIVFPYLLFCGLICVYSLDNIKNYSRKEIIITLFIMCVTISSFMGIISKYIIADVLATVSIVYILYKYNNKFIKYIPIAFIVLVAFNASKLSQAYPIPKKIYSGIMGIKSADPLIKGILTKDKEFYRFNNFFKNEYSVNKVQNNNFFTTNYYSSLINTNSKEFYRNTMNVPHDSLANTIFTTGNNIMFYTYMGTKYITLPNTIEAPIGYKKIIDKNNVELYKNENVFPLGYATNKTYSYDAFKKMDYPQKQEILLKYAVTKDSKNLNDNSYLKKTDIRGEIVSKDKPKYIYIKEKDNGLDINVTKNDSLRYKLDKKIENKLLFINFDIVGDIPAKDRLGITINGVKNALSSSKYMYYNNNESFQYVLSSNKTMQTLNIKFDQGNYKIRNLRCHTLDYSVVKNANKNIDKFNVDRKSITSKGLKGNIKVRKDGWFVLTIPYDKGFTMKIDGIPISYEKVNGGLIGFKIKEGYHNIQLNYTAPGFRIGQVVSGIALIIFIIIFIHDLYIIRKRRD